MPSSFLSADAGFPRLTADIPAEERLNRIENYLYMLLEQLRYTLANLGEENFNEQSLKEIGEEIGSPIMNVVTDLAGNVSTVTQTATALTSRLDNFNGSSSTIEQTATSISTRLDDFNGSGSTIEQTVSSIDTAVFDPNGALSLVSQKADRIDWIVASGTSAASMTLTSDMLQLIADEVQVYGAVTFSDLENPAASTFINGDNITLNADANGDSVSYLTYKSSQGSTFAQLHTRDNQSGTTSDRNRYAFVIETPGSVDGDLCAMKLESGDSMSLESGWMLYMEAYSQIVMNNGQYPTRIQANANATYSSSACPADCYSFCKDGIYYGSTRIVAI